MPDGCIYAPARETKREHMPPPQPLPIETQHALRKAATERQLLPADVISILDAAQIAEVIIKEKKKARQLTALCIARRLLYCINADAQ